MQGSVRPQGATSFRQTMGFSARWPCAQLRVLGVGRRAHIFTVPPNRSVEGALEKNQLLPGFLTTMIHVAMRARKEHRLL